MNGVLSCGTQAPNKQLQRTVMDRVPGHKDQCAAAALEVK
jgi:hypothetical protein